MLFRKEHIEMILARKKTMTRRIGKRVRKLGRTRIQRGWYDWTEIEIEITRRLRQRLGDITPEDIQKEGYDTLEEFKSAWIKIHYRWNPNMEVWVYEFRLVQK